MFRVINRVGLLIRYLTTARDNQTPSLIRILALAMGTQFVGLAGWTVVVLKSPFDPSAYGTGAGLLLAALGAALRISMKSNAGNDPPPVGG